MIKFCEEAIFLAKNKRHHFFAMLSRMKYISRWALMRNTHTENISEHSLEVAGVAHALAVIHNKRFGGNVNAERAAVLGVYHDTPEIITGDMPTPVKYYSAQVHEAYAQVEDNACRALVEMLPEDLREEYAPFFIKQEEDRQLWKFVKAADKICALTKCIEEAKAGNTEFEQAAISTKRAIEEMNMPEAKCFIEDFLESYGLTLDEMTADTFN
ncbi:MAG: 5'-deoxynucleotidase [Clostridia bacterium]|nr:5'-deoxynucleotidase [Clostridia bacterium]